MFRRTARTAWLLLLWIPAAADARSRTDTRPQIPPITLDEGLVLSACDDKPLGPDVPAFRTEARCVESLLRLVHVSGKHRVRFLYYDPQGNLYTSTKSDWAIEPSGGTGYHKRAWVRHRLPIAAEHASMLPGAWKLAVWLDGLTVAEHIFRLEGRPAPEDPKLERAQRLYLELRYEETLSEIERLGAKAAPAESQPQRLWWLALTQTALGQKAEADRTLERLLELAPAFALEPDAVRDAGGEGAAQRLEALRSAKLPSLYRKTTALPQLELSSPEAPPQLGKRRRWYQKWWFYAGVAAVAIPATALLAGGDKVVGEPGPPSVSLAVHGDIDEFSGLPCSGMLTVDLDIQGGQPPYEAIVTIATAGTKREVQVEGMTSRLDTTDVVLLKQNIAAEGLTSIQTPRVLVACLCGLDSFGSSALLRFAAIVKDSRETTSFETAMPGRPVPATILDLLAAAPQRVVRQEVRQPVSGDPYECPQEP